jgi:signal transduction histidine kinase
VKTKGIKGTGSNQLRWVVLLLAIAVILPTVCLLWFMSQVVKNERLVVRQKLVEINQKQLGETVQGTNNICAERFKLLNAGSTGSISYQKIYSIVGDGGCDGLVVYDAAGNHVYPLLSMDASDSIDLSEIFRDAWKLEFIEQELLQAAKIYEDKAKYNRGRLRLAALIGQSRCLEKLGEVDKAIETCKQAAFSPMEKQADDAELFLIGNARLLMLKFTEGKARYKDLFEETFSRLIAMIFFTNQNGGSLFADQNLFFAQKALDIAKKNPGLESTIKPMRDRIRMLMSAEELSMQYAGYFPTAVSLKRWPADKLRRLKSENGIVYGLYHKTKKASVLALLSLDNIAATLVSYEKDFKDDYVDYRIINETGIAVAGLAEPKGEPFATGSVGEHFPGWKVELYFKDGDVFDKAAGERIATYTWTGILVIALILVAGAFAGRAVTTQIKVNKLKNDFIATVSHELKTPLASMRLLVDTLLEGTYKDQQQAREYLEMTGKENKRLSRLIDNFLTFSRMERNKQAFKKVKTSPAEIARTSAEAVKAKFDNEACKFYLSIGENLPDIPADLDAMVTVIVNLLDNAYKYTYDKKSIMLKVYKADAAVCFAVSDNGIGMSRRSVKRIFKRFYQVDRSLARHAEGCGLGLSIAKFIVDAHKGTISVESKLGEGSTFTVRIPVGK